MNTIKPGSSFISSSMSVGNQELIVDNALGKEKQVDSICKTCRKEHMAPY